MQKKWKWCLKKISVEKKSRKILKVKKWLQIHNKKYFTFEKIKENNNNNKKQTKNLTKVNDQFLSMVTLWLVIRRALEKCFCWLDEEIEGWRSGKSRKTEAKKKIQDLNGVGWSVLGAVTTLRTIGVSILYNLYMVVSYLFQISNQCYKKLSFLQYKDNSYVKETRLVLIFKRHWIE